MDRIAKIVEDAYVIRHIRQIRRIRQIRNIRDKLEISDISGISDIFDISDLPDILGISTADFNPAVDAGVHACQISLCTTDDVSVAIQWIWR